MSTVTQTLRAVLTPARGLGDVMRGRFLGQGGCQTRDTPAVTSVRDTPCQVCGGVGTKPVQIYNEFLGRWVTCAETCLSCIDSKEREGDPLMCDATKNLAAGGQLACNTPGVGHHWHHDDIDDVAWADGRPVPLDLTPKAHTALTRFPTVVCLCGSTRFYDEFRRANLRLTLAGEIVLSIGCDTKSDSDLSTDAEFGSTPGTVKTRLDELHKRKIDLADYVLVLNVGGYVGESTRSEIAYARALGKTVRYLVSPSKRPS